MPEARGMLNVALPAAVSHALLRKLTQQASYRKQRGTVDSTSQTRRRIDHCVFPLQLVLPEQPVRVSQILSLEPGDVLELDCSLGDTGNLWSSGKVLFNAHPVRTRGRRAAQVHDACDPWTRLKRRTHDYGKTAPQARNCGSTCKPGVQALAGSFRR